VGDIQDPSHSVLLSSEPIKRPSQHSVAIQATPTLFTFRRGKGSTGGQASQIAQLRGKSQALSKASAVNMTWTNSMIAINNNVRTFNFDPDLEKLTGVSTCIAIYGSTK